MAGYGMGGYVGGAHDKARIARQEKEREASRKQYEEAKKKSEQEVHALRRFGGATSEVSNDAGGGWEACLGSCKLILCKGAPCGVVLTAIPSCCIAMH